MSRFKTWQLFAICVVVWGTTWHAITYQVFDFSAESGVAVRFALAGLAVLAFCRWRGVPLARSLADHVALALQGVFLYGVVVRLRLSRRAIRPLGAGRGRLLGVAASFRNRRRAPVRRGAEPALRRRRRARRVRCRRHLLDRDHARERQRSRRPRRAIHGRVGAAVGDRQPRRQPQPQARHRAACRRWVSACSMDRSPQRSSLSRSGTASSCRARRAGGYRSPISPSPAQC